MAQSSLSADCDVPESARLRGVPSSDFAEERLLIGVDGEALRKPLSGVGRYVLGLGRALDEALPRATFFVYSRLPAERLELPSERWILRQEASATARRLPSFLWLKTRGAELCRRDGIQVFWAGRTLHPRLAPPVRTVATVHDLNHLLVPETMQKSTLWSHRLWFSGDLARADCVIANSRGTAQRVRAMLRREVRDVITPGVDPAFHPQSAESASEAEEKLRAHGVVAPYLLSVSTHEPRKNLRALLTAFLELKAVGQLAQHRLVLVGASGWKDDGLTNALAAAKDRGVVTTGYVAQELLPALYANADAFVFPSLYEGFGMPVLEARACGSRVVVSDSPELCESGGPDAISVRPDVAGIREGILQALTRPRVLDLTLPERHSWQLGGARMATVFSQLARRGALQ